MVDPFVVVGGDAAGLSAASKLKREEPNREVIVFEKGNWVSYAHCGMPYYVKGDVRTLTDLLSLSPDDIDDRGIDLRRQHAVVAVEPANKTVTVQNEAGRFEQPYGDLLIATGAHAMSASIDTVRDGVFTMHSMDAAAALQAYLSPADDVPPLDNDCVDTDRLEQYTSMDPPESVAIVGGGYVGIEMAEAFGAHDLDIHLFQRSDQLLPPFGKVVRKRVAETLRENDVTLHLGTEVDELIGDGHVEAVAGDNGQTAVDLVLIGIGIRPNTELIAETDIARGTSGAIATDEYGRTNREHVYAADDCAEMRHTVTGVPEWVPLGLTANRAGRAVSQTCRRKADPYRQRRWHSSREGVRTGVWPNRSYRP